MRKLLIVLWLTFGAVTMAWAQTIDADPQQTQTLEQKLTPEQVAKLGAPPALTTEQKQQLIIASQQVQLLQLQLQQAQQAFNQLIQQLTPSGYSLNEKLELVKLPEPPKKSGGN